MTPDIFWSAIAHYDQNGAWPTMMSTNDVYNMENWVRQMAAEKRLFGNDSNYIAKDGKATQASIPEIIKALRTIQIKQTR